MIFPFYGMGQEFRIVKESSSQLMEIYKNGIDHPLVTMHAKEDMRAFLHPIIAPDGKGVLTEIHPAHHLHQTGVYWGLKKVNGRDFFMNTGGDYYEKQSLTILEAEGSKVSWETVYHLLDEGGEGVLRETQHWQLQEQDGMFFLDLKWKGEALKSLEIEQFFVGGLFIRMPWNETIKGEAMNALGERNKEEAEGHRAIWLDVGMEIQEREDWGHIAVLDHPDNISFPTPWRVDNQLGVGPSRQILGGYSLSRGEVAAEKYRLVVYTGELNPLKMKELWKSYACTSK